MKKVLLILAMSFAFTSCFSQKKIENSKQAAEEEDLQPEIYEHNQVLKFTDYGLGTRILKEPFSEKIVHQIQSGDEVKISAVYIYPRKENFLKVETSSGKKGYISIRKVNPYYGPNFRFAENIKIDGKNIRILTFSGNYCVADCFIYSLPSENSSVIHEITHEEGGKYYDALEITEDYKWIKVKIKDWVGWVKEEWISVDKGGPTFVGPANIIQYQLIGQYMPKFEI